MTEYFEFSQDTLEALSINEKKYEVANIKISGLRVLVFPSGLKTYYLYRKVKGQPKKIKIGRLQHVTLNRASKKAIELNSLIFLGNTRLRNAKKKKRNDFS